MTFDPISFARSSAATAFDQKHEYADARGSYLDNVIDTLNEHHVDGAAYWDAIDAYNAECKRLFDGVTGPAPVAVEALSRQFSSIIREFLDRDELLMAVKLNRNDVSDVCHTHDYCDANELMYDAFKAVAKRDPDLDSDRDTAVWNAAWDLSKSCEFGN